MLLPDEVYRDKYIEVIKKEEMGRNILFYDPKLNLYMVRPEFVDWIKRGAYPGYHIRVINGIETPCSNPDEYLENNLG